MADRLIVIYSPEIRDEYLAAWVGLIGRGYAPETLPASRVLRLLRYPMQRAVVWPDVASPNDPLPGGAVVRLPVLREATAADREALTRWADYAASVRAGALAALDGDLPPGERRLIALQLAGSRRGKRAVLILTESAIREVGHLAGNSGGPAENGGAAAPGPADSDGGRPGGHR